MANQNIESLETEPSQACGVSSAFPSLSKLELAAGEPAGVFSLLKSAFLNC